MKSKKNAISPLIATVLLIGIAVAAASIIYVWLSGFIGEQTQKNNAPLERSCEQLRFNAELSEDKLGLIVNNEGNIPIKEIYIRATNSTGAVVVYEKTPLKDSDSSVPAIWAGRIVKFRVNDITLEFKAVKMEIIPVLYGTGIRSKQPKIGFCPEQAIEKEI